jgi:hypothetical protein
MFILKRLSLVRVVTYVIAYCWVVRQISDEFFRSTFGSPLLLYIAIILAVKCQEIYTNLKSENLNGFEINVFLV